jgi:hypothetical protein
MVMSRTRVWRRYVRVVLATLGAVMGAMLFPATQALASYGLGEPASFGPVLPGSESIAVEQLHHYVYVSAGGVIHKLGPSGEALEFTGLHSSELPVAGGLYQIAVDNSGTSSQGDLYAATLSGTVYKFDPSGLPDATDPHVGEGKFAEPTGVAVDSSGDVYVADYHHSAGGGGTVFGFSSSGVELNGGVPVLSGLTRPNAIALNSKGDLYVAESGVGTLEFTPDGLGGFDELTPTTVDSNSGFGVTVDLSTNDVFVDNYTFIEEFSEAGTKIGGSFMFGETLKSPNPILSLQESNSIAVSENTNTVFATDRTAGTVERFVELEAPPSEPKTGEAKEVTGVSAKLEGALEPAGKKLEYEFKYNIGASCAGGSITTVGEGSNAVSTVVEGLVPSSRYTFCLVAGNVGGTTAGEGKSFETLAVKPAVKELKAAGVTPFAASVEARVNPNGKTTKCQFEYGLANAHEHPAPCEPGEGSIPVGGSYVQAGASLKLLTPHKLYHYRISVESASGTAEEEATFETLETIAPRIETESATGNELKKATLAALINPEFQVTTCKVEYGTSDTYGTTEPCSTGLGEGGIAVSTNVTIEGLQPGITYHYRFTADNAKGESHSEDKTFTTLPLVVSEWVVNVSANSVTFSAEINPQGAETTYQFQYGTSEAYEADVPLSEASAGSGSTSIIAAVHTQGLSPGTLYHYRVVAKTTGGATIDNGPDHTFTTEPAGAEFALPDGRAWELVSPQKMDGAQIEFSGDRQVEMQASEDGGAIAYMTNVPVGSDMVGNEYLSQLLATRGPNGWSTQDIDVPNEKPTGFEDEEPKNGVQQYMLFSPDLSTALVEPSGPKPVLSPEASDSEATLYLRDNANGDYLPLVTPANVPPNTKFGVSKRRLKIVDSTPDLSHVIILSPEALTDNAVQTSGEDSPNLYEWSGGHLQLVNVLPNGKATDGEAYLGRNNRMVAHSISDDGRFVVWSHENTIFNASDAHTLYLRDMVKGEDVQLGGSHALFQTASSDGSKVFFNESNEGLAGDLMEYNTETGTQTDLTVDKNPGESAGVQPELMGASEDGTYVYFVANGVLANGAAEGASPGDCRSDLSSSEGTCNLYMLHETGGEWKTTFIATLSGADRSSWKGPEGFGSWDLTDVTSRVSPNGRYVAFMSERSLTGYDNTDAVSGQPDEEAYLYDASTGRLTCVSCSPTGERPVGVLDEYGNAPFVDPVGSWGGSTGTHWLAGSFPGWAPGADIENGFYQPRYLSDSGRLFFDSPEALVPQDTDGLENVYEYEPSGVGGCTNSGASFDGRLGGCVSLISSGTSGEESAFFDASTNGDDVFFLTTSHLVPAARETGYALYDAHVCSAGSPCVVAPVLPPACDSADSCRPAPSPQPAVFGAPASATFSGAGNVTPAVSKPAVTGKRPKAKTKRHKAKPKKRGKKRVRGARRAARSRALSLPADRRGR